MQLGPAVKVRGDASDIVQETMLNAHRAIEQFRGSTDAEMAGWLRKILANTLAHHHRDNHRAKRDVSRERSMHAAVDASSMRLERLLAADVDSPSRKAITKESVASLCDAIDQLPETKREAIKLHYWHGWTLAQIGEHQERGRSAVAGDIHRGLKQLRKLMKGSVD